MHPPSAINDLTVVEYGAFPEPLLPKGYTPPPNGRTPLHPMQYVAICRAAGVDGFYTVFCTPDWEYVTAEFNETIEHAKRTPLTEFGQDVTEWRQRG